MTTKNPRVNAVLEPPVFEAVELLAKQDGVSLSQKVRDLVVQALEIVEDEGLEALAEARAKKDPKGTWVPLAEAKRRLKAR